jgi:hypothetical protein
VQRTVSQRKVSPVGTRVDVQLARVLHCDEARNRISYKYNTHTNDKLQLFRFRSEQLGQFYDHGTLPGVFIDEILVSVSVGGVQR